MKKTINISPNASEGTFVLSNFKQLAYENYTESPSVKMVLSGVENYTVNDKPFSLVENRYLVVDKNQKVALNIQSNEDVNGICIFPNKALLNEVAHTRISTQEALLDNALESNEINLLHSLFGYHKNRTGQFLNQHIPWILQSNAQQKPVHIDGFYYKLAECLVDDQLEFNGKLRGISSTKKSTKEELFRRVTVAKDYMEDNYSQNIQLDELAQYAHLSKYHFTRTFKALFQLSPYQYLLQLRLQKAQLLLQQNYSYQEVSNRIGFSDGNNLRKALKKSVLVKN